MIKRNSIAHLLGTITVIAFCLSSAFANGEFDQFGNTYSTVSSMMINFAFVSFFHLVVSWLGLTFSKRWITVVLASTVLFHIWVVFFAIATNTAPTQTIANSLLSALITNTFAFFLIESMTNFVTTPPATKQVTTENETMH